MAKSSKTGGKGKAPKPETHHEEAEAASTTVSSVTSLTPKKVLETLLKMSKRIKDQTQLLSGEAGQAIANAVENQHLHKKAFSHIKALDRMEPERLADYMEHFDHYFVAAGLEDRVRKVMKLPLDGDNEGEGVSEGSSKATAEPEATETKATNVVAGGFRPAPRAVGETAGS